MAECGICERLKRFVERRELARDPKELLLRVETPRQPVDLVAQPVEALEERVELSVSELLSVHVFHLREVS